MIRPHVPNSPLPLGGDDQGSVSQDDVVFGRFDVAGALYALAAAGVPSSDAAKLVLSQVPRKDIAHAVVTREIPDRLAAGVIAGIAHAVDRIRRPEERDALMSDFGFQPRTPPLEIMQRLADCVASERMRVRLVLGMSQDQQGAVNALAQHAALRVASDPIGAVKSLGAIASALPVGELRSYARLVASLGVHPLSVGIAGGDIWQTRRAICGRMGIPEETTQGITNSIFSLPGGIIPEGMRIFPMPLSIPNAQHPLPDGMAVDGNCRIQASDIRSLPPGMVVTGELFLSDCTKLAEVPADLRTQAFQVWGCPTLEHLPDADYGSLDIRGCRNLDAIPAVRKATLTSRPGLFVSDCPSVAEVRGGFFETASIHRLGALMKIDARLSVGSHLWVADCCQLKEVTVRAAEPSGMGLVDIRQCGALERLGGSLAIHGTLNICDCPALEEVPGDIDVSQSRVVSLHGNARLTACMDRRLVGWNKEARAYADVVYTNPVRRA